MSFTQFTPHWFYGYDVALEFVFFIVSFTIALYAFRIFNLTDQRQVKLFGLSFMMISLSYLIQSVFNFFVISETNLHICNAIKLRSVLLFDTIGLYVHIILLIIGLSSLVYMTCRKESKSLLLVLMLTPLISIFFANNSIYLFFVISSLYLLFISLFYIRNYVDNKQNKTLIVAIAFLFLFFGNAHFIVSVNHQLFYVIGHVLELVAYLLILWNFYLVLKK